MRDVFNVFLISALKCLTNSEKLIDELTHKLTHKLT